MGKGEAMMSMETMALLCRHEQWLRSHLVSPRTLHSCERERERERERDSLSSFHFHSVYGACFISLAFALRCTLSQRQYPCVHYALRLLLKFF